MYSVSFEFLSLCDKFSFVLRLVVQKNNLILISSSMKSISQFRLKKLICHTQPQEQKEVTHNDHAYGSFLFKDRITNNFFKFQEAMKNNKSQLDLKEWVEPDQKNADELKHALRTYKFAKNFEMNCIRDKYYENKNRQSTQKTVKKLCKEKKKRLSMRKSELLSTKRDNRQTINEFEHTQNDLFNQMKEKQQSKRLVKSIKWWKKQQIKKQNVTLGQNGQILYDKAINHLKNEMKDHGEYLINLPISIKRKNLIKQQLKQKDVNLTFTEKGKRYQELSKNSPLKIAIERLEFTPFDRAQYKTLRQMINTNITQYSNQNSEFLKLVKAGYINQALIEVKKRPQIVEFSDREGNNIFHFCVKDGNDRMCYWLLKALPLRVCQKLLQAKNNVKVTICSQDVHLYRKLSSFARSRSSKSYFSTQETINLQMREGYSQLVILNNLCLNDFPKNGLNQMCLYGQFWANFSQIFCLISLKVNYTDCSAFTMMALLCLEKQLMTGCVSLLQVWNLFLITSILSSTLPLVFPLLSSLYVMHAYPQCKTTMKGTITSGCILMCQRLKFSQFLGKPSIKNLPYSNPCRFISASKSLTVIQHGTIVPCTIYFSMS